MEVTSTHPPIHFDTSTRTLSLVHSSISHSYKNKAGYKAISDLISAPSGLVSVRVESALVDELVHSHLHSCISTRPLIRFHSSTRTLPLVNSYISTRPLVRFHSSTRTFPLVHSYVPTRIDSFTRPLSHVHSYVFTRSLVHFPLVQK